MDFIAGIHLGHPHVHVCTAYHASSRDVTSGYIRSKSAERRERANEKRPRWREKKGVTRTGPRPGQQHAYHPRKTDRIHRSDARLPGVRARISVKSFNALRFSKKKLLFYIGSFFIIYKLVENLNNIWWETYMAFIYRMLLVLLRRCICSSYTCRLRETRLQLMYRKICRYRPRIILKDEQKVVNPVR